MDHLPLPKGKAHIRVPNLTAKHYTRGDGDFDGYPAGNGWTMVDLTGNDSFGRRSPAEVQSFFQSWLYFGCAIEVLAVSDVEVRQSDLLDESGQFLSTRRLRFFIRQWREAVEKMGDKINRTHVEWAMKTALILKRVSDFVDLYCLSYYVPQTAKRQELRSARSPLSELTWMAIIALGHTLMAAMIKFYHLQLSNHWGASPLLKRRLLYKGWCPLDIQRSLTDFGIDLHYYLAKKVRPEIHISHQGCTETACNARNVDRTTYQQRHVRGSGDCGGSVKSDISPVVEIITVGDVPICKWDPLRKQVDVVSSRLVKKGLSDPPFVAISHVWSDGMGNLAENSLLECQLDRVQELVQAATQSENLIDRPQHFWIDTLCIPVGQSEEMRTLRRRSIAKMADIYQAASAVLVLSSTLQAVATTDSEREKGLALYLNNWNRRLWTCQEGLLAKKLLMQFSDKAIIRPSEIDMLGTFLREDLFAGTNPVSARMEPLAPIISILQSRSTSWKSDETICFGTLMRLDLKRLQDLEQEMRNEYRQKEPPLKDDEPVPDEELARRRMKMFLSMVKVFPREIIFNSHERLNDEGFRWAPVSFLGIPRRGFVRSVEGEPALLDKHGRGLKVRAPGFIVTVGNSPPMSSSSPLLVTVLRKPEQSFEMKITATQPSGHSPIFAWKPATKYGVIVEVPMAELTQEFFRSYVNINPETPQELRLWLNILYSRSREGGIPFAAVIGYLRDPPVGGDSKTEGIQIHHECVANIALLDPSSLYQDGGSDSDWQSEDDGSSLPHERDLSDNSVGSEQYGPSILRECLSDSDSVESEQGESGESGDSSSGYSLDGSDIDWLRLEATKDFSAGGLDGSEESESSEDSESSEESESSEDSESSKIVGETWNPPARGKDLGDLENDSETFQRGDVGEEVDPPSDWGSVIGEGENLDRENFEKETHERVEIHGVADYIEDELWFLV